MSTSKRIPEAIRAEIRAIRSTFVGTRQNRAGLLDEALERKRADAVADTILALEAELAKAAK